MTNKEAEILAEKEFPYVDYKPLTTESKSIYDIRYGDVVQRIDGHRAAFIKGLQYATQHGLSKEDVFELMKDAGRFGYTTNEVRIGDRYYTKASPEQFNQKLEEHINKQLANFAANSATTQVISTDSIIEILKDYEESASRSVGTGCNYKTYILSNAYEGIAVKIQSLFATPQVEGQPKKICYCGSLRFMEVFKNMEYNSVWCNEIALLPCIMFIDFEEDYGISSGYKQKADELHKRKIDICDEVYVLNVGGYIGESTRSEIEYAKIIGKPIKYLEP